MYKYAPNKTHFKMTELNERGLFTVRFLSLPSQNSPCLQPVSAIFCDWVQAQGKGAAQNILRRTASTCSNRASTEAGKVLCDWAGLVC